MAIPATNASGSPETGAAAADSPGAAAASAVRPTVDITALTTRDELLLELGEVIGGQAAVRPVDSIAMALELLKGPKRGQVLVIDTRDVADLRAAADLASAQAPHAVLLVFAPAEGEKLAAAAVKGSNVFAVLPVPIDKGKTSAVLETAMAHAVAKKAAARGQPASTAGVTVEAFRPRPVGTQADADPKRKWIVGGGVGLAVVALAAGAFWLLPKDKGEPAAPLASAPTTSVASTLAAAKGAAVAPPAAVDTSIVKGKLDELLEKARLAMRERRYAEPNGDNALLYYRSAAAADATSAEAKDGLQRVAGALASRLDEALSGGRLEEAALALASFKVAAPNDPRSKPLELQLTTAQVSKALAEGNTDRAAALVRQAQQSAAIPAEQLAKWRAEVARRQADSRVQRLASLVAERIQDGKLVEPANDSAKGYFQQLHELAPSSAATQRAASALNSAYLRKAREARNSADADRWIAEAKVGGLSANDLAALQHDVTTARQKAAQAEADHLVQLARARTRDGRLTEPAQDSAAYYLGQLQSVDPANASLAQAGRELAGQLVERAKASALAGKSSQVDADIAQAKRWGADPKDILAVQQIQNTPKSAGASRAAAAAAAAGVSTASLVAGLKRQRYVAPEFPQKAISLHVRGSVTIAYIVGTKGDTRDVRVIEATPPGVFEQSATTAVKRWTYQPVIVNGTPVEVPVRAVIHFELPSN